MQRLLFPTRIIKDWILTGKLTQITVRINSVIKPGTLLMMFDDRTCILVSVSIVGPSKIEKSNVISMSDSLIKRHNRIIMGINGIQESELKSQTLEFVPMLNFDNAKL